MASKYLLLICGIKTSTYRTHTETSELYSLFLELMLLQQNFKEAPNPTTSSYLLYLLWQNIIMMIYVCRYVCECIVWWFVVLCTWSSCLRLVVYSKSFSFTFRWRFISTSLDCQRFSDSFLCGVQGLRGFLDRNYRIIGETNEENVVF